jgi:NADH dehydrogenase
MRVCVTGGTGFVGRCVVSTLLASGHTVHALVRPGSESKLPTHPECLSFAGDSTDPKSIGRGLEGCDTALHLVGIRRREIERLGLSYDAVDVASAVAMAQALRERGVRRIVLLSAGAIGNSQYVRSKGRAERAIIDAGLDWTIYRPAFVLGPGQQWPRILTPLLASLALLPGHIGDVARRAGNVTREQLALSMVSALQRPDAIGRIYDVPAIRSTGSPRSAIRFTQTQSLASN